MILARVEDIDVYASPVINQGNRGKDQVAACGHQTYTYAAQGSLKCPALSSWAKLTERAITKSLVKKTVSYKKSECGQGPAPGEI